MIISFSPQRRDGVLALVRQGDTLVINGEPLDLSAIPDGATLPADAVDSDWIKDDIHRIGGMLHLTLLLPHGPSPSRAVAFPADIVDPPDGLVEMPHDPHPEHGQQEETHDGDD